MKFNLRREGRALSFALRLRKRYSGTNQTHTAKNAATSMKAGATSGTLAPLFAPYRYLGPRYFFASWALAAKWKNQVKWSVTTNRHERRNRGEVREMYGHEDEKLLR
jgi:hypothetical protein